MTLSSPAVTVILPVHNGARYLPEAITSILMQTWTDFELIIIDDGSTDESLAVIRSYNDSRIRSESNGENRGLEYTLNKGLRFARGKYIARMDADDVALPERLARQVAFLDTHPQTAVVASTVERIDEGGHILSPWQLDRQTLSAVEIRTCLARTNCIAHPSIMARAELLRSYGYNPAMRGKSSQDYELWLRMCSDDLQIEKIPEPLLLYRVHSQAVTVISNRPEDGYIKKTMHAKKVFLRKKLTTASWNGFALRVICSLAQQNYALLKNDFQRTVKVWAQQAGGVLGRTFSLLMKFDSSRPDIFMFFPFYHTGGAERVHADIITCMRDYKPRVFIIGTSKNSAFKKAFSQSSRMIDISWLCKSRVLFLLCVSCLAEIINRSGAAVAFGCNTGFFYELLPLLKKNIKKIDLIHAFGGGAEELSLPHVSILDARVVINARTVADFEKLYAQNGIGPQYLTRIHVIENKVAVPLQLPEKTFETIRIVYVGRGTEEKRVHLVGKIARLCSMKNPLVSVTLIGNLAGSLCPEDMQFCSLAGELYDDSRLRDFYTNAHFIVLTSTREGFPLVLMEAMAYGVVPVTTNVGGI
ncbi:MAG: glycosyltransferase, partial [Deltaproteobacteria bacterium]|nr:glycosyltransferase [Deltaproteobacteria bacterium]